MPESHSLEFKFMRSKVEVILASFIMFLVSRDHNKTPQSSYKILAQLSQRCSGELDNQCKIHYLQVHRQNETHQNQTADMS